MSATSKEELKKRIEELNDTLIKASLNHDVWRVYWKERAKYVDIMNHGNYHLFFVTSIHAHFTACIIALYRLYESNKSTHNIPQLLKKAYKFSFPNDTRDEIDSLYKDALLLWDKIYIIRNKVFGHRTTEIDIEEAFKEAGIKYEEIEQLIKISENILNKISKELFRTTNAFNMDATKSTRSLLETLQKANSKKSK